MCKLCMHLYCPVSKWGMNLFHSRDHEVLVHDQMIRMYIHQEVIFGSIVRGQIGDIKTAERYFQDVEKACQMKGSEPSDHMCVLMNRWVFSSSSKSFFR